MSTKKNLKIDTLTPKVTLLSSNKLLLTLAAIGAVMSLALYIDGHNQTSSVKHLVGYQQNSAGLADAPNSADPVLQAAQENSNLINKVSQLVVLPVDEEPTIATVTDLAKLADQPFFANAQLSDKVLIYATAKKAVLYRPATNKIIELAPLSLDNKTLN